MKLLNEIKSRIANSGTGTEFPTIAAIDLGSNSFHMIVAQVQQDQLHVIDRLREMVRLAEGLDQDLELTEVASTRALACLERFGQRMRGLPKGSVRAVGTNTLRKARDAHDFICKAEAALGHPVEIISGLEEARLVYLGVSHNLPEGEGRRLVIDIGGGSTELIIGEGFEPLHLESLYMGCVSFSERYFRDGAITKAAWKKADIAARLELEPVVDGFRRMGWESAAGASGTVRAIREVVQQAGWCQEGICKEGLRKLKKHLIKAGHINKAALAGLQDERKPVFTGGVAILNAAFDALAIEHMRVSDGALREGLVYDILGRITHEDVRERTVYALSQRYHVDQEHAQRVEQCAVKLLDQVRHGWRLEDEEQELMLRWAARLHEIGLVIAHSGYHKHGAYLLANSDLPGFSRREQALLAALVRGHRRKLFLATYKSLPKSVLRLCVLLRIAIVLHRSRSASGAIPAVLARAKGKNIGLVFPDRWLELHPLTAADLEREAGYLSAVKRRLDVE